MRDRGKSVIRGIAAAIALVLAGCAEPPGIRVEEVCDSLCRCQDPIPAEQPQCNAQCTAQLANVVVPDSCLACLDEPLCTSTQSCFEACLPQQVNP